PLGFGSGLLSGLTLFLAPADFAWMPGAIFGLSLSLSLLSGVKHRALKTAAISATAVLGHLVPAAPHAPPKADAGWDWRNLGSSTTPSPRAARPSRRAPG